MAKIAIKRGALATGNYTHSSFIKDLRKNKAVAGHFSERDYKKIFTSLKDKQRQKGGGSLYTGDVKDVLGQLKYNQNDNFSSKKALIAGRGIFKSGKWYKRPATEVAPKTISSGSNKIEKPEAKTIEKSVAPVNLEKKAEVKNEGVKQAPQSPRRASSGNIAIPILYKKLSRSKDYLRNQIARSSQSLSRGMSNLENSSEDKDENINEVKNINAEENIYNLLNDIEEGNKK
jgi:hypothetical protein